MAEPTEPTSVSSITPPVAPVPPVVTDPPEGSITMTGEQLNDRLKRGQAAHLKNLGFGNDEEVAAMVARNKELEDAEKEKKRAALSDLEKSQSDLEIEKQGRIKAEKDLNSERFKMSVFAQCAKSSVTNTDYALYEMERAKQTLPEGETLNIEKALGDLVGNETKKAALGLPATLEVVTTPVVTTPSDPNTPPPATPPKDPSEKTAFDMSPEEWRARRAAL